MRSLGSEGVAAVARASGASTLLGRVTTTSAPPPGRGRSRKVPPDDWASARAKANSISPPPALCVKRNGVTNRCRSEEHTSELQSQSNLVCRLLLDKKQLSKNSNGRESQPFLDQALVGLPGRRARDDLLRGGPFPHLQKAGRDSLSSESAGRICRL